MTMRTMQNANDMRKPTISSVKGAIKLHGSDLSSGKLFVPFLSGIKTVSIIVDNFFVGLDYYYFDK